MPKISVGIVTYNRINLLRNLVQSILNQDYKDIEIIIGNDFTEAPILAKDLGFDDDRVIIINNQINLGEVDNLNNVLRNAKGQYFVWQFDDDLFHKSFFTKAAKYFSENSSIKILYTDYIHIFNQFDNDYKVDFGCITNYAANDFFSAYLRGDIRVLPYNGIFEREALIAMGGAEALVPNKIGIYSEYYLLARVSKLVTIGFCSEKLCMSRIHNGSWSRSSGELNLFCTAGLELLRRTINICNFEDSESSINNYLNLSTSIISTYFIKSIQLNIFKSINLTLNYCKKVNIILIENRIISNENYKILKNRIYKLILLLYLKYLVKKIIPLYLARYLYPIRAFLSKITRSPF